VTSVTFSYDVDATRYCALTDIQAPRLEIIQDLEQYVTRAMMIYAGAGNPPPTRLIFFRDGVSEGEYEAVAAQEIKAINSSVFIC
jgi:eukaryotic translation initiation factor 2C